ncbi:MAG: NAD-dependent protein deacylase [Anaerolineaceae bacterium 4572_5.1]|nr:MAG: NAD-dependent protein deacylase [Anaerolineaceae bacterium 4572_5.1]
MNIPVDLIRSLQKATRVAALTGAGISAESGLKTFRDSQDGYWSKYRPEDLATPQAFARDPQLVWDWYAMRRNKVAEAKPNSGHYALVEMESRLPNFTLITQNVDGYHIQAGSKNVLELHGNIQRVKCSDGCGVVDAWEEVALPPSLPRERGRDSSPPVSRGEPEGGVEIPRCPKCDAYLRPDVVWFGENLPRNVLESALSAAYNCQAFFSIGTSALVQPAASLAYTARQRGALIVEINLDPTPLTSQVDFALHGKSGEILPQLMRQVWGEK